MSEERLFFCAPLAARHASPLHGARHGLDVLRTPHKRREHGLGFLVTGKASLEDAAAIVNDDGLVGDHAGGTPTTLQRGVLTSVSFFCSRQQQIELQSRLHSIGQALQICFAARTHIHHGSILDARPGQQRTQCLGVVKQAMAISRENATIV